MSPSPDALLEEALAFCADPRLRASILRHSPSKSPAPGSEELSTRIHPSDQMLVHSLEHHRDVGAALSQYFGIGLQQYQAARQIMDAILAPHPGPPAVLDFACGYGRMLRFLAASIPGHRLWASELQPDALRFVEQELHAQGLASEADPARFHPAQRFDFIWVASLFSHLPEATFHAWLAKLLSLLTPRGVLAFSVRDAALLPVGKPLPETGFLFERESENPALGADIYGTAYASEAFVRDSLSRAAGAAQPCVRLPRALAHEQDLYVVANDPAGNLDGLGGFRRGPWGWVDRRSLSARGVLELEGWAASLDDGVVEFVEIVVDGKQHRCTTGVPRRDVSDALGDARMAEAGWRFRCELGQPAHKVYLEVAAFTARGESALLYAGLLRSIPARA